ncbi:MAG: hypothetical protein BRC41_18840 [Cyanobacteria bacterium QH_9_48_43]|nr:MAG: hypothetical protein BRC41_18840 [Cyanobacteria bacterium QH_9_48_43]PSP23703.1 MAG: hypothetical protein BRC52_01620 [Cyanobacteria bacterium SW_5_48_44]
MLKLAGNKLRFSYDNVTNYPMFNDRDNSQDGLKSPQEATDDHQSTSERKSAPASRKSVLFIRRLYIGLIVAGFAAGGVVAWGVVAAMSQWGLTDSSPHIEQNQN